MTILRRGLAWLRAQVTRAAPRMTPLLHKPAEGLLSSGGHPTLIQIEGCAPIDEAEWLELYAQLLREQRAAEHLPEAVRHNVISIQYFRERKAGSHV